MPSAFRLVLRLPFGPVLVVGVALGAALMPVRGARAQTDTTEAAPTRWTGDDVWRAAA